jgi:hypothetical protein
LIKTSYQRVGPGTDILAQKHMKYQKKETQSSKVKY